MKIGTWVKVNTVLGKINGVVEAIDYNSNYNIWRKDPANYPIVVKLQKPYSILGKQITHMTFDWQGFSTAWERFLRLNQLELY